MTVKAYRSWHSGKMKKEDQKFELNLNNLMNQEKKKKII